MRTIEKDYIERVDVVNQWLSMYSFSMCTIKKDYIERVDVVYQWLPT